MSRGFVIMAQNTDNVNYTACAEVLRDSILQHMPNSNVSIITELPYGDLAPTSDWKLVNDWQVYEASPYDETIKIEADMFLPRSIEHWWEVLSINDVTVCSTIRNYKGEISDCRWYRSFIDDNKLPDVYNALTYFKKSEQAETFFKIVRDVFENWEQYKNAFVCNKNEIATTDWAYAIACRIIGEEKTTLPSFTEFSFTHMKQFINDLPSEKWTDSLVYEISPNAFRIQTHPQRYPFHYHIKEFSTILSSAYGI